ncbi:MAG: hypothetical protein ACLF0G_14960 [Candidatus Brocadiia bacterium]
MLDAPSLRRQAVHYRGQWVATSKGQVVAHGFDFRQVAIEACQVAQDIVFERVPDPAAALWRPAVAAPPGPPF